MGSVTSKIQKRRETYIKTTFPEYAGNRVSEETESVRKGRRLGGTFSDSSKSPIKLDGSESFYDTEERRALVDDFAERLRKASSDPEKLQEVVDQYRIALELYETSKEPISHERARKIKEVTSIDFASESKGIKPLKIPPKKRSNSTRDSEFPTLRDEDEMMDSVNKVPNSMASKFWDEKGAKTYIEVSSISIPAVFSSTLNEHTAAKRTVAVFDHSYQQSFTVSGEDCLFVMDHFITAPLRCLNIGDSVNTCVVDSKGYVIALALVSRTKETEFEILLDEYKESVFRYLAQYVVYSRQSGMEVSLKPQPSSVILCLTGPESPGALLHALSVLKVSTLSLGTEGDVFPNMKFLGAIPPMTSVSGWTDDSDEPEVVIRRTAGNEIPQFSISIKSPESVEPFLRSLVNDTRVVCAGAYAWDILRMERGLPRPEIDIPSSNCSPVKASLTSLVDQRKIRESVLFGHDRISNELLRGTTHRRVAIVSDQYVYGGCKILSAPHRHVVGEVTSCAWSPTLKKRVCQAYVKPEYAVSNNPLLVNLPQAVPETLSYRFKRRIVRQGAHQNVFRKLIPAKVVSFPLES
jgi:glycine cleavage system aminomethyltransferase T